MEITAVVLTNNEEKNIKACLASLQFCDEIIVVDDNSTDKTVEIAQRHNLKVKTYQRALNGNFAAQRNFGLEKCTKDWALFVDADERVSPSLRDEITNYHLPITIDNGFYIKRQDNIWGRQMKHGEFGKIKLLRLAKVGSGRWVRKVHEVWEVKGKVEELANPLLHYPHQTLREFIADVDWQSSLHAEANLKEGKRSNLFKIAAYPKLKFIKNWIFGLGFLDGTEGFVAALIMSFHSFLAWSKLWKMQKEKSSIF